MTSLMYKYWYWTKQIGSDSRVGGSITTGLSRILDLGFKKTIELILDALPPKRQTLLFSATMRTSVQQLATLALDNPELLSVRSLVRSFPETLLLRYRKI